MSENLEHRISQPIEVSKFLKLKKGFKRPSTREWMADKSDISTVKNKTDIGYDKLTKTEHHVPKIPSSVI